jgi:hypothetical protein
MGVNERRPVSTTSRYLGETRGKRRAVMMVLLAHGAIRAIETSIS